MKDSALLLHLAMTDHMLWATAPADA